MVCQYGCLAPQLFAGLGGPLANFQRSFSARKFTMQELRFLGFICAFLSRGQAVAQSCVFVAHIYLRAHIDSEVRTAALCEFSSSCRGELRVQSWFPSDMSRPPQVAIPHPDFPC